MCCSNQSFCSSENIQKYKIVTIYLFNGKLWEWVKDCDNSDKFKEVIDYCCDAPVFVFASSTPLKDFNFANIFSNGYPTVTLQLLHSYGLYTTRPAHENAWENHLNLPPCVTYTQLASGEYWHRERGSVLVIVC